MTESTIWWLLAGTFVAVELVSGTFYLLMVAIGLVAAAVAAHLGASVIVQVAVAAAIGGGAVVLWYSIQRQRTADAPVSANRDVNLDVGETVQVEAWNPDGTATVKYRGASWTVVHRPGQAPSPGPHRVAEVIGNRLLVDKC
ncbi:MAG: NfeD family protein [Burkholderiaceae bacterium]